METKSRFEVIAELESKKRQLIIERDTFQDKVNEIELNIKNLIRQKEDLSKKQSDYEFDFSKNMRELEDEKNKFLINLKQDEVVLDRRIEDRKNELKSFKDNAELRRSTYNELIKGIDESLARFSALAKEPKS